MSQLFELFMVLCFGASWPVSIYRSWTSRTTKGKSVFFLAIIFAGYICGITSKLVADKITYVTVFYVINLCAVGIDICIYFRNRRIEQIAEKAGGA